MMKIYELKATAFDVTVERKPARCVDVYAFATDGSQTITVTCEFMDKDMIFVYDGEINIEDPGEGPMEEYGNRAEALASEYGDLFRKIFDLADSLK